VKGHAVDRSRARTTGQPKHHGLGLVIEGVTEHNDLGIQRGSGLIQRLVASGTSGGLRASDLTNRNVRHLNRVEPKPSQNIGGAGGNILGDCLDTVLDDHGTGRDASTRGLKRNRCGERQAVWPTRTSDQHQVTGNHTGGIPAVTNGATNIGDGRGQTWAVGQLVLLSASYSVILS
jgi:hypothetical protein